MKLTENEKYFLIKLHCKIEQAKMFVMQGFNFDLESFLITMEIEGIKKEIAKQNIENLTKKGYVKIFKYRIAITDKGYKIIQKYCY